MENEALISQPTSRRDSKSVAETVGIILLVVFVLVGISALVRFAILDDQAQAEYKKNHPPDITIPSMDFTVLNITETQLSVKWDLTIRIPGGLPGFYTCLDGDLRVFMVYKGVTIATSPAQSYNLRPWWPKLLKVSLVVSVEDMDSVIVKDIMKDVTGRDEMRFVSRLLLPDCRYGTSGKMNYACDEATLRFEPGSQRNASLFDNQPTCHYLP